MLPEHIAQAPYILRRLLFYLRSQHWSRDRLEAYQDLKLSEMVRHAGRHVPYYRELFRAIGLEPEAFRGRQDLHLIPPLDKEVLRSSPADFVADDVRKLGVKIEKTSGSTGTPLNLHIDRFCRANKYAAYARAFFWAGYFPGAARFVLKGFSESKSQAYGFDLSRNMVYLNSSQLTKENCLGAAALLKRHKPVVYEGYARSFLDFYRHIREAGLELAKPKGIFVYGETVTPQIREHVESALGAKLFDFYSHAENAVMICEMKDNHRYLMEDFFFPEILTPEGEVSPDGYGELAGTGFYNYAMPLIRYKTRDYVQLADRQDAQHPFRRIANIEGRMDDCILLPDGRKIYFAEGAVGYARGVIAAQYIQDAPDHLTIALVVDDSFSTESYPLIEQGLVKRIGNSLKLSFRVVSELEKRNSGKTPFIINKLPG